MKALKSKLATELLADPKARVQLRRFLLAERVDSPASSQAATGRIEWFRGASPVTVFATVVPKAKVS